MRYAVAITAGGVTGAVSAPLGAIVALIAGDFTGWSLLFSAGSVIGTLPIVLLFGAILGMVLGYLTAWLFGRF